MLGKVVTESQRDWDTRIPAVMAAYWATVHDATGYFLNFLTFGRELRAAIDLVLAGTDDTWYANPDEFVEALRLNQREAYALARDHLRRRAERNKNSYDMRCVPVLPQLGMTIGFGIIIR